MDPEVGFVLDLRSREKFCCWEKLHHRQVGVFTFLCISFIVSFSKLLMTSTKVTFLICH